MAFAGTGVRKAKKGTPLLGCRCVFINDGQYSYNVRDELIAADEVSYNYDDIGNRTTAEGKTYTANNLNQYTQIDDFVPEYDDDGNQTLIKTETGIWSVTYNAENRPIRWESGDTVITMAFDRMGRRVEMRTQSADSDLLQRFVYDNYLCIQQLRGTNNALFHSYIWDPTEPIATRPLVFLPASGEIAYYFHDGNKNVSDLVDIHGNVAHYDYTPFGVPMASSPSENPFGFSSEVYDVPLGLSYYNNRHYNPIDGKWCGRDPLEEDGGLNLSSLFKNSPLQFVDVYGMSPFSVVAKQFAKMGVKKALTEYVENRIKKEILGSLQQKAYKKFAKELGDEALEILDTLDSEWWEIVVECIPVAGDIYGTGKLGIQLQKLDRRLSELEQKAEQLSQIAKRGLKAIDEKRLRERVGNIHKYKLDKLKECGLGGESVSHFDVKYQVIHWFLFVKRQGKLLGSDV